MMLLPPELLTVIFLSVVTAVRARTLHLERANDAY
jgi:hypothetical protein